MSYCIVVRDDIDSHLIEKNIKEKVSLEYNNENPDIVVAIGGDGTIIKATHLYPSAIIFGVHTGHLGFYANYSKDEIDGPVSARYTVESGEVPYYKSIAYDAEIVEKKVTIRYEFAYYVDKEGIANGTSEVPKARDLLIAEPYKIMTGDEISEETLNKIDKAIEDAYLNGNDEDEIELEVNGPFKVNIIFDGLEITFQIISSGRGDGTSA